MSLLIFLYVEIKYVHGYARDMCSALIEVDSIGFKTNDLLCQKQNIVMKILYLPHLNHHRLKW